MTCVVVVGLQWGDGGKGKIVDILPDIPMPLFAFKAGIMRGIRFMPITNGL